MEETLERQETQGPRVSCTLHRRLSEWIISSWTIWNAPFLDIRLYELPWPRVLWANFGSFKVIGNDAIRQIVYDFLLMYSNSNYGSTLHRFWYIWCRKCCSLKSRSGVTQRSLQMTSFDRGHTTIHIYVFCNNFGAILYRFCDIASYSCKFAITTSRDSRGSIARFI